MHDIKIVQLRLKHIRSQHKVIKSGDFLNARPHVDYVCVHACEVYRYHYQKLVEMIFIYLPLLCNFACEDSAQGITD